MFEIERGASADEDEANDDPGVFVHSCNFDNGLCGWMKEKRDDLHWEPVKDVSAADGFGADNFQERKRHMNDFE
uniref:Uncharacterized protein n=1 Tax=Sphaerodactylus townsendi TaxID=933632 RepID=A0ACB8E8B6_9SAUR